MSDRIEAIDVRLRSVERAVIELGVMAKMLRVVVVIMGLSLGVDVQGMI